MKQKLRLSKLRRGIFKPSSPVVIVVLLYSLSSESIATNRGYYTDRSSPVSKMFNVEDKENSLHQFSYGVLSVSLASENPSYMKVAV